MDANEIVEWLRHSPCSAADPFGSGRRGILRFPNSDDYDRFLHMTQAMHTSNAESSLASVRPLNLIQAVSCPIIDREPPAWLRGRAVWEEDAPVQVGALPKGALVTDKGIPWGVKHIQAPRAWSKTTGYRVKVGVIDTGVDFGHPDLRHSLERGINLLHRLSLPQDDNGHGTHISGTIAAANELQGMIGVAPRSMIYPVKAFDYNGTAFVSDIVLGIEWCVRNQMNVINMSFGMKTRSKSLQSAVSNAYRSGVLIVASSGNDGKIGEIDYPARYSQTIAVGATNRQSRVAAFTNRSGLIDIYAPGDRIVSAWLRGKHREMSGTSMATSHVTGAIALLLALKPGLSPGQIKTIVKSSAKPLRKGKTPRIAGELNVLRMIKAAEHL
ncbi:S8 family peptidase [Cohnella lupini]|uniref:Subtilase family protein n=1 Tax=Cohnella lupini TaxID=1294267 RepID=A0A3D9HZM0_9BACL|nr:S8 family peptidase [Cohnella lupini]RED54978.1 subtilase family protein [Cohnella lupini]